jgi:hypothetical protein
MPAYRAVHLVPLDIVDWLSCAQQGLESPELVSALKQSEFASTDCRTRINIATKQITVINTRIRDAIVEWNGDIKGHYPISASIWEQIPLLGQPSAKRRVTQQILYNDTAADGDVFEVDNQV